MIKGLAVVILAGGEGRRIGGGKMLRELGGETLIDRALCLAGGWSPDVRVAVRTDAQAGSFAAPILDDDPALQGPLGGLAAALRLARESGREAVLTLPCDAPFLPFDLPGRLIGEIGEAAAAIAASGGKIHPVCALWRVKVLDRLPTYAASGRLSLRGLADEVGYVPVAWPADPIDPFFNINSEADLQRAEEILRR